jgi:Mg/Co/Ni transporter MgtE
MFEGELAAVIVLSSFIPLLIGTGGNTGAQTVSTVIRGLALGEIHARLLAALVRELGTVMMLGALLGAIAFVWRMYQTHRGGGRPRRGDLYWANTIGCWFRWWPARSARPGDGLGRR